MVNVPELTLNRFDDEVETNVAEVDDSAKVAVRAVSIAIGAPEPSTIVNGSVTTSAVLTTAGKASCAVPITSATGPVTKMLWGSVDFEWSGLVTVTSYRPAGA